MILIVDDDNAVWMSVSLALKRAGYAPWAVGNEDDALAAVRDERVALVILDMNLTLSTTGRQGVEMLRKIRILRPEIPVIMITAWGTIPQAVTTMAYGATDFVTKPWSNADLVARIKKALAGSEARNEADRHVKTLDEMESEAISEALRRCAEVFHQLKSTLKENGTPAAGVGDEGGYAPNLKKDEDALKVIVQAIEEAGYKPGEDFMIAIDAASSEWWNDEEKCYIQPKSGKKLTQQQLVKMWKNFAEKYPIISLEDGMAEEDWEGWAMLTKALGDKIQLVGDDLFVTNTARLAKGIELGVANSILIKVNQIGSLTETLDAIQMANRAGYTAVVSHRSGETEDATIADIAVALNAGQIKTGAPSRTDRVAKYNQLLRIEEELGEDVAQFLGKKAFFNLKNK